MVKDLMASNEILRLQNSRERGCCHTPKVLIRGLIASPVENQKTGRYLTARQVFALGLTQFVKSCRKQGVRAALALPVSGPLIFKSITPVPISLSVLTYFGGDKIPKALAFAAA